MASRKYSKGKSFDKAAYTASKQEQTKQLRAGVDTATEQLLEELQGGKSMRLVQYLGFSARFHQYSENNQWLIMLQRPDATRVAGYSTWEKLGYHVAKGSKGIEILAPRPWTTTDEESGEEQAHVGFKPAYVFDVSQLVPEEVAAKPVPVFFEDMGSDEETEALYQRMTRCMRAEGIRVDESRHMGSIGAQGYSVGGRVAIKEGLSSGNALATLGHEWAHELLHQGKAAPAKDAKLSQKECHAEATAYVVLAHFGIRNEMSSDYLLQWGNTPEILRQELAMVHLAAKHIIDALEAAEAKEQSAELEQSA
jgi:hypothetical protein